MAFLTSIESSAVGRDFRILKVLFVMLHVVR